MNVRFATFTGGGLGKAQLMKATARLNIHFL